MKIKEITIKNWKCFINKTFKFNNGDNIINMPNGSGKSSLIQAIWFCLYDQRPTGYDFNNLRNDVSKSCEIDLYLQDDNLNEYHISRKFGIKSVFQLYKNKELIGTSKQDISNIINSILPQSIVEGLWCQDSLTKSFVLDSNYLISILDNIFKEPLELKRYIQTDKAAIQRNINNLKAQIRDVNLDKNIGDKIQKRIKEIEDSIKNKIFIADGEINKANICKEKTVELENLENKISIYKDKEVLPQEVLLSFKRSIPVDFSSEDVEEQIKEFFSRQKELYNIEKSKLNETHPLLKYPSKLIDQLITESETTGKCQLCGNKFNTKCKEELESAKLIGTIDHNKISTIEEILSYEKYNVKQVLDSIEYYKLFDKIESIKRIIKECPNWEEIINNYNEENTKLYKELDELKDKLDLFNKEYSKITDLLKAQKDFQEINELIKIIDDYLVRAKEYYSQALTSTASDILNRINPRYSNIIMDDNKYHVIVTDSTLTETNYLPVIMLSSGEQTLVAISLIISAQKLFAPGCPLVFDESFVNLDRDNIISLKKIFNELKIQNFIVSHDPVWLEN